MIWWTTTHRCISVQTIIKSTITDKIFLEPCPQHKWSTQTRGIKQKVFCIPTSFFFYLFSKNIDNNTAKVTNPLQLSTVNVLYFLPRSFTPRALSSLVMICWFGIAFPDSYSCIIWGFSLISCKFIYILKKIRFYKSLTLIYMCVEWEM